MADANAIREPPMSPDPDDPEPVRIQSVAFSHSVDRWVANTACQLCIYCAHAPPVLDNHLTPSCTVCWYAQEEPRAAEDAAEDAPPVESSDVPVPAPEIEPASAEGAEDPAAEEGGAE